MVKHEIAYGRNNVLACLESGIVFELYIEEGFKDQSIFQFAREQKIILNTLSKKQLNDLTTGNHQGVVAKVKAFEYAEFADVLAKTTGSNHPIFLLLDGITDPHNFGAIIRSAEAFGVNAIIIKKDRQVHVNPTVMKVASGAQNDIDIIQVTNLSLTITNLQKAGFWIVGSSLEAASDVGDLKYDFPIALVVGSEGKGISRLVLKNCDYLVKVPMQGKINSLNVSVATGVILAIIRKIQLYF